MKEILNKYVPMTETSCYILLAIAKTPKHGYGIVQHVKHMTDNRITLGNGTMYGTLGKMEKDGLIHMIFDDEKKKVYEITALGMEILLNEKQRISELDKNLSEVDSYALFNTE